MTAPLTNASNINPGFILAVLASVLWGLTYCLDERVLSSLSVFKLYFLGRPSSCLPNERLESDAAPRPAS